MNNFASTSRVAAAALAVAGAGLFAPAANAAYTGPTAKCQGASIIGGGASFQRAAQTAWGADQLSITGWALGTSWGTLATSSTATSGFGFAGAGTGSCGSFRSSNKTIKYAATGSGGGRNSWSANGNPAHRDSNASFTATDEAPSPAEEANMESVGITGAAQLLTVPVAQSSIAVMVNLPEGCRLVDATRRKATIQNLEKIWYGEKVTWGSLLNSSTALGPTPATDDLPQTQASCTNTFLKRVVRKDSSGTTFAFKQTFDFSVNNRWSTGATDYTSTANNTVWPNDAAPKAVLRPASNGNGPLADLVAATPSAIGYSDLATARSKGFGFSGVNDRRFWLAVTAPKSATLVVTNDPAKDAGETPATYGANCSSSGSRIYTNQPSSSLDNWYNVTGASQYYVGGNYPFCTLTYALSYDNNEAVQGMTEPKARTVSDYLKYVTGTGQGVLAAADYQALPVDPTGATPQPRNVAQAGADMIDW